MKKFIRLLFLSVLIGVSVPKVCGDSPIQSADCGRIDRHNVYSPQLNDTITVDVWLPDSYDIAGELRFPVLYMHDGQNLFDASTTWNGQAWEMDSVACELITAGKIKAPIVVGIHSGSRTRVSTLMPERAVAGYGMDEVFDEVGLHGAEAFGDEYGQFVVNTFKPLIDINYRTIPDRDNTMVMGSSMGGLMSLYLFCEYPSIFGGAACLSTHWNGTPAVAESFSGALCDYMDKNLPDAASHKLYLDHGTETIDAFYEPWHSNAVKVAQRHGYNNSDNFMSIIAEGAAHDERSWSARVALPLLFLFNSQSEEVP